MCGVGVTGKSCVADAMMFTPETAKMIYMRGANHPNPMSKISQRYTQPSSIVGPNSLSGFLRSDSRSFEIRFNKKMNLSWLKISKAYQGKSLANRCHSNLIQFSLLIQPNEIYQNISVKRKFSRNKNMSTL